MFAKPYLEGIVMFYAVSSSLYLFGMWTKVQFLGCDGELSF